MRPIDADALAYEVGKAYCFEDRRGVLGHVMNCIVDAPTIDAEPVTHGEWIFQGCRDSEGRNVYCCSNCDFYEYVFPYNVASWRAREKYCPACGALMDGGVD